MDFHFAFICKNQKKEMKSIFCFHKLNVEFSVVLIWKKSDKRKPAGDGVNLFHPR